MSNAVAGVNTSAAWRKFSAHSGTEVAERVTVKNSCSRPQLSE